MALTELGMLDSLCGKIRLCAVPAEELLEIEYRSELKAQGKIKYFGGKSEFLSGGYFDGVNLAFMVLYGMKALSVEALLDALQRVFCIKVRLPIQAASFGRGATRSTR